jgi:hypothetical protein
MPHGFAPVRGGSPAEYRVVAGSGAHHVLWVRGPAEAVSFDALSWEGFMKRRRIAAVVLGSIAAVALVASGSGASEETPLKRIMGENFAGLQVILKALITSNYGDAISSLDIIHDHAVELTKEVPDSAKGDRDHYLADAYLLQTHAADLKGILELLIEHDKATTSRTGLSADQLRDAAAAHYGGMVITCVNCHNRLGERGSQ